MVVKAGVELGWAEPKLKFFVQGARDVEKRLRFGVDAGARRSAKELGQRSAYEWSGAAEMRSGDRCQPESR